LLGGTNISKEYTEIRRATSVTAHEDFDILSFNNDVALIELDKPVQFGATVQPACLPDGGEYRITAQKFQN
jgi:Trypsin